MPELSDDMYCSEQICIPPTFPYLLRQYAKAAIRSQPSDLLKWSTAYFRCLSLGVPPPVKPRLEYPIPRDYHGLTPGWLKALLYQLQKNQTVHFKILWDRWIGACLVHETLIQILCLGRFTDNTAVPWLRFIALCAGFLTDCLTQTMILICEILTEEPEGGSAMIPLEVFLDLYKFLARIDASVGQWLPNIYFTDSILNLYKKKAEEELRKAIEEAEAKEESIASAESEEEKAAEERKKDEGSVISCPSVQTDEYPMTIEAYLKSIEVQAGEGGERLIERPPSAAKVVPEEDTEPMHVDEDLSADLPQRAESTQKTPKLEEGQEEELKTETTEGQKAEDGEKQETEETEEPADKLEPNKEDEDEEFLRRLSKEGEDGFGIEEEEETKEAEVKQQPAEETETALEVTLTPDLPDGAKEAVVDKTTKQSISMYKEEGMDLIVQEDLEKLKHMQKEMYGESDDDVIGQLKKLEAGYVERTKSDEEKLGHYDTKIYLTDEPEEEARDAIEKIVPGEQESIPSEEEIEKPHEMIYVDAVPGIGGIVPDEVVEAVCKYMKEMAREQHGMVMPRNIRHYNCPPLEIFQEIST